MTALNFVIQPDQIVLATDTLSLAAADGEPLSFVTKFLVLPHLRTVATGTGNGPFLAEWYSYVRASVLAQDVDHLNQYSPSALRRIAAGHDLAAISATVYHFGYSRGRDRFLAYAYRSTSDFSSEEILEGFGVEPQVAFSELDLSAPEVFVQLMERQRADDQALPKGKRIGIGGEIQCVHMQRDGISISTIHRFASYDDDYGAACARL